MMAEGVFAGIRVLELGQYVAAPYAAELLANGGADVIKIEPIEGDSTRINSTIVPGEGRQYIIKSRGKRSVPIDLGSAAGRTLARQLALTCDVVISNMRPGLVEKLGLDYESLAAADARIIFGEISGFGHGGPLGGEPALDIVVQAYSGLMIAGRGFDNDRPVSSECFLTDYSSAALLAFGIASALFVRERTGRGQKVSTSLFQAALMLQHGNANVIDAVDSWKRDIGARADAGNHSAREEATRRSDALASDRWFFNTFTTLDGVIAVAATGRLRSGLARIIGLDDASISEPGWEPPDDPRPHERELTRRAREAVATWRTADLLTALSADGIPCGPVQLPEQALLGTQAAANGYVETFDHPVVGPITLPAAAVRFSGSAYATRHTSPAYGEHTRQVLDELGIGSDEIERLVAAHIVGDPEHSPFR